MESRPKKMWVSNMVLIMFLSGQLELRCCERVSLTLRMDLEREGRSCSLCSLAPFAGLLSEVYPRYRCGMSLFLGLNASPLSSAGSRA